jgi:uncharacterized protein (TIGR02145 family)
MTDTTALISSIISSNDAVTARGVCWSTTDNPTVADKITTDSLGTGRFRSTINGLTASTIYYIRAYVTTAKGTTYNTSCKFKTPPIKGTTVSDMDGNVYNWVTIGGQVWLVENLQTTKYRNGDTIRTTLPVTKIITLNDSSKFQWAYNNDIASTALFGRLYTWYAVNDARKIAPEGWHVATDAEWTTMTKLLSTYFAKNDTIAKQLAAPSDWTISAVMNAPGNNLTLNNSTGFAAKPNGFRYPTTGVFSKTGVLGSNFGCWWSANETNTSSAFARVIASNNGAVFRVQNDKRTGASVRCVRDAD